MTTYKRTLLQHISDSLGGKISKVGELLNNQYLTYNPLTFWNFQRVAKHHAPAVVKSIRSTLPSLKSVIDIGCGGGAYAAEFQNQGLDVKAIENSSYARKLVRKQNVTVFDFDLNKPHVSDVEGRFDLAYCFEVAEHIPTHLSKDLIQFLTSKSDLIIFTAAPPGQLGMGHINCQPNSFWEALFADHQYVLCNEYTETLAKKFKESDVVFWLTNNVTVYKKAPS